MSLLSIIVVLVIVGLILWLIDRLPIQPPIKLIINVVVIVFLIIWLLQIMIWVIIMGLLGLALNIAFLIYSKTPYKWYILFKVLCVTYAVVAYSFYMVDKFWYDFSWLTFENFRYVCIRPLVVMLFTWFIADAWLRRWGRWRGM